MDTLEKKLQKRTHVSLYAILFLALLLGLSVLLESCSDKCETTTAYTYYAPVYTSLSEIRNSVSQENFKPIETIGKIYFKDGWIFLNQPGEGIHIIDNRNPTTPVNKTFISIPGNYDLAIKGNTLYADSYIDLVLLDVSDLNAIHEIKRMENVFSNYNSLGFSVDANKGMVTDWEEQKNVEVYESECDANVQPWGGFFYAEGIALQSGAVFDKSAAIAPGNGSVPGVGGSMARFTIHADHLYALDAGDLQSINVQTETDPQIESRTPISWDIETIFPYKNNLFIGSQTGMHILDISTPSSPVKVSTYAHVRVCDPVVVQDDLAYVTLRSGNECAGFTNQLEVISIKNVLAPELLEIYPMTNPHGLGIDQSTLFVCDGDAGLKIYDASDITSIDKNQLAHYGNVHAYDVIPFNNIVMMIGRDGILQYDYSNPKDIKFLSKLEVADAN
jgi:hypothetical protein